MLVGLRAYYSKENDSLLFITGNPICCKKLFKSLNIPIQSSLSSWNSSIRRIIAISLSSSPVCNIFTILQDNIHIDTYHLDNQSITYHLLKAIIKIYVTTLTSYTITNSIYLKMSSHL